MFILAFGNNVLEITKWRGNYCIKSYSQMKQNISDSTQFEQPFCGKCFKYLAQGKRKSPLRYLHIDIRVV